MHTPPIKCLARSNKWTLDSTLSSEVANVCNKAYATVPGLGRYLAAAAAAMATGENMSPPKYLMGGEEVTLGVDKLGEQKHQVIPYKE